MNKEFGQRKSIELAIAGLLGLATLVGCEKKPEYKLEEGSDRAKVLSYAESFDRIEGISLTDREDLKRRFFESDPRHVFRFSGRLGTYYGNSGFNITPEADLREVLYNAKDEEISRVLKTYQ